MNPYLANIFGVNTEMSSINRYTGMAEGYDEIYYPAETKTVAAAATSMPRSSSWSTMTEAAKHSTLPSGAWDPNAQTTYGSGLKQAKMPDPIYAEDPMQTLSANNLLPESGMTAKQIGAFVDGTVDMLKAGSYFSSAISSYYSGKMKEASHKFSANQYEKAATTLERNMRDVTRAAQLDSNVYKLQGSQTKAAQKTAMAGTGFAVGKGSFGATLNTTDARTNYNVALTILKSELQNAEIVRKAGSMRAQAEIEKGNAKIAKRQGKVDMINNIISGASYAISGGANFYIGSSGIK